MKIQMMPIEKVIPYARNPRRNDDAVPSVAYIPVRKVVGISKLARLVDCFARRLQIQERMTTQIATTINEVLKPLGVATLIQAHHSCMGCRGVKKPTAKMTTSCLLGELKRPEARAEFFSLIK